MIPSYLEPFVCAKLDPAILDLLDRLCERWYLGMVSVTTYR